MRIGGPQDLHDGGIEERTMMWLCPDGHPKSCQGNEGLRVLFLICHVLKSPKIQQRAAVQGWTQGMLSTNTLLSISPQRKLQFLQGLDEAVLRNIQAVNELSDLVRTSFGPNGASFRADGC